MLYTLNLLDGLYLSKVKGGVAGSTLKNSTSIFQH